MSQSTLFKSDKQVLLLGLGNLLMEDEGVGIHILRNIEENYSFEPEIEIVDGGTAGYELLPFIEDFDKVLMIDAVEFGNEPGFVGVIENDNILTELTNKMSLHHLGITDVLSSAKLLDYMPSELYMLGVEPYSIEVKMELSDAMESKVETITQAALKILEKWDIKHKQN